MENREQDPIDKYFEDLDADVIPDVGKGPIRSHSFSFFISEEVDVITGNDAHIDKCPGPLWCDCHDVGENLGAAVTLEEMNAQMYEDFDKELPPATFLLPQGATDDLWIIPGLSSTCPEFESCIDLDNAPSWPDLTPSPTAMHLGPLHILTSAAESTSSNFVNGGESSDRRFNKENELNINTECFSPIHAGQPPKSARKRKRSMTAPPTSTRSNVKNTKNAGQRGKTEKENRTDVIQTQFSRNAKGGLNRPLTHQFLANLP